MEPAHKKLYFQYRSGRRQDSVMACNELTCIKNCRYTNLGGMPKLVQHKTCLRSIAFKSAHQTTRHYGNHTDGNEKGNLYKK
jgi:hypothetical protein